MTDVFIAGGFNVYPTEVENALKSLPGITECAVFGCQDHYWGERVEAAVSLERGCNWREDDLKDRLKPLLGAVKTPKYIHFVVQLPRNPVGKAVRRDVKAMIEQQRTPPHKQDLHP